MPGTQRFSSDESSPENVGSNRQNLRYRQPKRPQVAHSLDEEGASSVRAHLPAQDTSHSLRRSHLRHQRHYDQRNGRGRQRKPSSNDSESDANCSPPSDITSVSRASEHGREMFEIFRTLEGEEYTVYVREDGKRFYVDWEEQVKNSKCFFFLPFRSPFFACS